MGSFRIPSLELVFGTLRVGGSSRHDLAIAAVHTLLLGKDFLLTRLGDELTAPGATETTSATELLPAGWNDSQDMYAFQYVRTLPNGSHDKYLLKAIKLDDGLHISLLRLRDEKVANVSINVASYITEDLSTFDKAFKNTAELSSIVMKGLVQPFDNTVTSKPVEPVVAGQRSPPAPNPAAPQPLTGFPAPAWQPPPVGPFDYGRADLDPLGGGGLAPGGGGMLLDPMRQWRDRGRFGQPPGSEFVPGGLPRGAVPPGARFDPFGPPLPPGFNDPRPRPGLRGPDPDHLPPPGYGDMFM